MDVACGAVRRNGLERDIAVAYAFATNAFMLIPLTEQGKHLVTVGVNCGFDSMLQLDGDEKRNADRERIPIGAHSPA
jgi:hypothetical protein